MKQIDTVEKWIILRDALIEKGWIMSYMQYSYFEEQGFHAVFFKQGKTDVEVVTHTKEVQAEIIKYNSIKYKAGGE